MVADGQVRSDSGTGSYERYRSNGIFFGCTGWAGIGMSLVESKEGNKKPPGPKAQEVVANTREGAR
jgi:hypothetical protein